MRTANSIDIFTSVEVFVHFRQNELASIHIDLILLPDEFKVGKAEETG